MNYQPPATRIARVSRTLEGVPCRILCLLRILIIPLFAGSFYILADSVLRGQGFYDGPFTNVAGTTPNLSYDTGGYLTTLTSGQIYTGPFISGGGACGFVINSTGQAAIGESLSWGQSIPYGSALILGPNVFLEGDIDLGTDPTATRQIDAGIPSLSGGYGASYVSGEIFGSGNLLIQDYSQTSPGSGFETPTLYTNGINITGGITVNNADLWGVDTVPAQTISASSFNLSSGGLEAAITGTPNMTLTNGSSWLVNSINSDDHSVGSLNGDSTSMIDFGELAYAGTVTLTVNSGYFAGTLFSDAQRTGVATELIKDGPGIFTLSGNNTTYEGQSAFSGQMLVKQGTLLVSNTTGSATGTGRVTVMSGAALGGTGIIAPTGLEVESGGKIDLTAFDPAHPPATGTHKLTIDLFSSSPVTFDAGASFAFDLGANGTSDNLDFVENPPRPPPFGTGVETQVNFNDNSVDFNLLPGASAGTYTLFNFSLASEYTGTLQNGSDYYFTYNPESITVTIEDVPEPSLCALVLLGVGFLLCLRRTAFRA